MKTMIAAVFHKAFDIRFDLGEDREIAYPRHVILKVTSDLLTNDEVVLDDTITHTVPFSKATGSYAMFDDRTDDRVKFLLKP
jgi:threonine dehydrogenase-like Zn-dependent dehydrogenase